MFRVRYATNPSTGLHPNAYDSHIWRGHWSYLKRDPTWVPHASHASTHARCAWEKCEKNARKMWEKREKKREKNASRSAQQKHPSPLPFRSALGAPGRKTSDTLSGVHGGSTVVYSALGRLRKTLFSLSAPRPLSSCSRKEIKWFYGIGLGGIYHGQHSYT